MTSSSAHGYTRKLWRGPCHALAGRTMVGAKTIKQDRGKQAEIRGKGIDCAVRILRRGMGEGSAFAAPQLIAGLPAVKWRE